MPVKIAVCTVCGTEQHVVSEGNSELFLGCGHSVPKPAPKKK